jgi:hypothetical protein
MDQKQLTPIDRPNDQTLVILTALTGIGQVSSSSLVSSLRVTSEFECTVKLACICTRRTTTESPILTVVMPT